MVCTFSVCQLMDNHISQYLWFHKEEGCVEHDHATGTTAAPLGRCKLQFDTTHPYPIRCVIDVMDQMLDATLFTLRKRFPEQSMQSTATNRRTDGDRKSSTCFFNTRPLSGAQCEVILRSMGQDDACTLSTIEQFSKGIDESFLEFIFHLAQHTIEKIIDVLLLLCLRKPSSKPNDNHAITEGRTGVLVVGSLHPMANHLFLHEVA